MRAALAIVGLLALAAPIGACSSSNRSANELPAESWSVADYTAAGIPAPDHAWTTQELGTAATSLRTATQGHRERLPHLAGPRSGAVFAHLVELAPVEDASVRERFIAHAERYDALNQLSKLYVVDALAAANAEWLALIGAVLHESVALQSDASEFIASFGPDDPDHAVRLEGVARMHQGWAEMLEGGVMVLADVRVAEPARIRLARDLRRVMPALVPALDEGQRAAVRDRLAKLREVVTSGPLAEALPAALP